MGEEEPASLDGQFFEFAKMMDKKRDGQTITLYNSDFWMRQAKLLDDRKLTMTDTGVIFNKFRTSCGPNLFLNQEGFGARRKGLLYSILKATGIYERSGSAVVFGRRKSEINWDEWNEFLTELCEVKGLDEERVRDTLTNCGIPGQSPVVVPQYRDFFLTYKPKEKMLF